MNKWKLLDTTAIPNSNSTLTLEQRDDEFSICISGKNDELMSSKMYGSEEALAELGCAHLKTVENSRVLVGGLGMGFTLAATLRAVSSTAQVTVAELIPAVVKWNHGALGECAGRPLQDARVHVHQGDIAELLINDNSTFDVILLDVDNGPAGLTHSDNQWLYSLEGLQAAYKTLGPEGMLAIWSAGPDPLFLIRLKKCRFNVSMKTVKAHPGKKYQHTIFLARKGLAM